jgi:hypothetical protein
VEQPSVLDINRLHTGRSAGFASEHVAGLKSEIPGRLNLGAERSFLRLT